MARGGSAAGASRRLGVSHATVLRRLNALETEVGTSLFDRLQTGYVPTIAGQHFVRIGEAIERSIIATQREVEGHASALAGPLRFTTTDSLADSVLSDALYTFRERFPAINVEMRITNSRLDLDRGEADVALRLTHNPPLAWVGKSLARMDWGLYATPSYRQATGLESEARAWLLPDGYLAQEPINRWLRERVGNATIAATADSFVALRKLAENGMGAAALPCFMARGTDLELLEFPPQALSPDIWLLMHPHLRGSIRIRTFMDHVAHHIRNLRDFIEVNHA